MKDATAGGGGIATGGGRWFVMVESQWSYWGERKSLVRDTLARWLARTNYGCYGQQ